MARKKLIPVVIDRKRWLQGELPSCLYRSSDKKMCCVGFCARVLGNSIEVIRDVPAAWHRTSTAEGWLKGFCNEMEKTLQAAYQVNDSPSYSHKEREKEIRLLLRKIGFKVTYTGKYPASAASVAPDGTAQ